MEALRWLCNREEALGTKSSSLFSALDFFLLNTHISLLIKYKYAHMLSKSAHT